VVALRRRLAVVVRSLAPELARALEPRVAGVAAGGVVARVAPRLRQRFRA
jgi:hypothetical protein